MPNGRYDNGGTERLVLYLSLIVVALVLSVLAILSLGSEGHEYEENIYSPAEAQVELRREFHNPRGGPLISTERGDDASGLSGRATSSTGVNE